MASDKDETAEVDVTVIVDEHGDGKASGEITDG
jgi:hypothetical protein